MDWKSKILSLTAEKFEELCYDIVDSMNLFINMDWHKGGGEKGCDIYAEKIVSPEGMTTLLEKWLIQCKRYKSGIPFDKIVSAIEGAKDKGINYFVLMSNSHISNQSRERIKKRCEESKINFINWTDKKFQKLLFSFPHLLESYFPEEIISDLEKNKVPQKIFEIEIGIPNKLKEIIQNEILKLMNSNLEEKEKNKQVINLIRDKIIKDMVDLNLRAFLYQQLSTVFFYNGDFEDSISCFDEALKITPRNKTVIINKGILLTRIGKYYDAFKCYDNIVNNIDKRDKIAWNNRGHVLEIMGKYKGSMYSFEKSIQLDPDFVLAKDNKAALLKKQQRFDEAILMIDQILKRFPHSKTTLNKKADFLREKKDFLNSYKLVNEILDLDSSFIHALNTKGVILEHNGKAGKQKYGEEYYKKCNKLALNLFERIIEIDQNFSLAHTNKTVCLINQGNFDEALKYINKVINVFPNNPIAWNKKSTILINMNRYDEALECTRQALMINSNLKETLDNEGTLYLRINKPKKAFKVAEKILKLNNKDADGWGLKSDALRNMGKGNKAEKCYKKALQYKIKTLSIIDPKYLE